MGYDRRRVSHRRRAEAVLLLVAGLGAGIVSAVLAVAPAWTGHAGRGPGLTLVAFLAVVVLGGVLSSMIATRAALSGRLLESLRAE